MKLRNIQLTIKSRKQVFNEAAQALKRVRKGEKFPKHEEISFENLETLRKVLTKKRMELLHIIKQNSPESIYELAKIVSRDIKSVNTDVHILEDMGFVSLEHVKGVREKVRPRVEFDKLNIEVVV